ncbi:hypothetical protein CJ030_MR6G020125 [Morella rubra]|uniref:Uncharacterized protein n=1 Tax=Morella rubra TaxID=262757 RepID=A0A6A1VBB9_9ROSI|nr:hypothetical protein CJ030_MR6G020125 [Morella rubra]
MIDLGCKGSPFTWTNEMFGRSLIQGRLVRGLANGEWRALFPKAIVSHLTRVASDHALLLFNTYVEAPDSGPVPSISRLLG